MYQQKQARFLAIMLTVAMVLTSLPFNMGLVFAASSNELAKLSVDGYDLSPSFTPANGDYTVYLPSDETAIPNVSYTAKDYTAVIAKTNAEAVGDSTIITVTPGEGGASKSYRILFSPAEDAGARPSAIVTEIVGESEIYQNDGRLAVKGTGGSGSYEYRYEKKNGTGEAATWEASDWDISATFRYLTAGDYRVSIRDTKTGQISEAVETAVPTVEGFPACGDTSAEGLGNGERWITEGSGTEDDPWVVTDKYQLNHIRKHQSGYYKLANDIEFEDSDYVNGAAFYNEGAFWKGIPGNGTHLDGAGHSIIRIKGRENSETAYVGLFSLLNGGAAVENLAMQEVDFRSESLGESRRLVNVGSIVGYAYSNSAIRNCAVYSGIVQGIGGADGTNTGQGAGGLIGTAAGGEVRNCFNAADVSRLQGTGNYAYVGGVYGDANSNGRVRTGLVNAGTVTSDGTAKAHSVGPNYGNQSAFYSGANLVSGGEDLDTTVKYLSAKGCTGILPEGLSSDYWQATEGLMPYLKQFSGNGKTAVELAGLKLVPTPPYVDAERKTLAESFTVPTAIGSQLIQWSVTASLLGAVSYGDGSITVTPQENTAIGTITAVCGSETREFPVVVNGVLGGGCGHTGDGAFITGLGTKESPWEIATAEQLNHVREHLTGGYFKLVNDIDLSGFGNWQPIGGGIGGEAVYFSGHFDGNNRTIYGLNIEESGAKNNVSMARFGYGLFGVVSGETIIENVILDSPKVALSPAANVSFVAGGLVGIVRGGPSTIRSCAVLGGTVSITDPGYAGKAFYAGGLVGYNIDQQLTLSNCFSSAGVSVTRENAGTTAAQAGGLAGKLRAGDVIESSLAVGPVIGSGGVKRSGLAPEVDLKQAEADTSYYYDESVKGNGVTAGALTAPELTSGSVPQGMEAAWSASAGSVPMLKTVLEAMRGDNQKIVSVDMNSTLVPSVLAGDFTLSGAGRNGSAISWKMKNEGSKQAVTLAKQPDGSWKAAVDLTMRGTKIEITEESVLGRSTVSRSVTAQIAAGEGDCTGCSKPGLLSGDGSAENPYQIGTPEQLDHIREHLDGHFLLTADIDLDEFCRSSELNPASLAKGGIGWRPIGSDGIYREDTPFTGSFDGQGHVISNMTIEGTTTGNWSNTYGLFGFTKNGAAIKNLVMENPQVTIKGNHNFEAGTVLGLNKSASVVLENIAVLGGSVQGMGVGAQRLGGVLACTQDVAAAIRNCFSDTRLISQSADASSRLGGIVGSLSGNSTFANCIYTGSMEAKEGITGGITGDSAAVTNGWYNADILTPLGGAGTGNSGQELASIELPAAMAEVWTNMEGVYPVPTALLQEKKAEALLSTAALPVRDGAVYGSDFTLPSASYGEAKVSWSSSAPSTISISKEGNVWKAAIGASADWSEAILTASVERAGTTETKASKVYANRTGCSHSRSGEDGAFLKGDGTEESPYEITTPEQLDHLRAHLGASVKLMNDISLSGFCQESELNPQNIANGGIGWRPIGGDGANRTVFFTGHFDGQGHVISGMILRGKVTANWTQSFGLFGNINGGAVLENFVLEAPDVTVSGDYSCQAGLVLGFNAGTPANVENVAVVGGSLHVLSVNGEQHVGSILGNTNKQVTIKNCFSNAELSTGSTKTTYLGGIAGSVVGGNLLTVEDCLYSGHISAPASAKVSGITAALAAARVTDSWYNSDLVEAKAGDSYGMGMPGSQLALETLPAGMADGWNNRSGMLPIPKALTAVDTAKALLDQAAFDWGTGLLLYEGDFTLAAESYTGMSIEWSSADSSVIELTKNSADKTYTAKIGGGSAENAETVLTGTLKKGGITVLTQKLTAQPADSSVKGCGHSGAAALEGRGTAGDPFRIRTAAQLDHVRSHLGSSFILMNDIDLDEFCQNSALNPANISGGGIGWRPIGGNGTDRTTFFTGSFDGRGHMISNMMIRATTSNKDFTQTYGLFGNAEKSASIRNLVLQSPRLEISGSKAFEAGTLLGLNKVQGTALENISVLNGSIQALGSGGEHRIGGIVGAAQDKSMTMKNLYADTEIVSKSTTATNCIGGIVGQRTAAAVFENCLYAGSITKSAGSMGGISGGGGTLVNCWYDADKLTAEQSGGGAGAGLTSQQLYELTLPEAMTNNWEKLPELFPIQKQVLSLKENPEIAAYVEALSFGSTAEYESVRAKNFLLPLKSSLGTAISWETSDPSVISLRPTAGGLQYEAQIGGGSKKSAALTARMSVGGSEQTRTVTVTLTSGCSHTELPDTVKFTAGDGTAADPYQISSAAQLDHLRQHLDAHAVLTADIDLDAFCKSDEGNPANLTTTGGIGWRPIGGDGTSRNANWFTGSLDGQGHVISNMTIEGEATGNWTRTYGLFGNANGGAQIKDLLMENPQITVTAAGAYGFDAGAVLGFNNSSAVSIENVAVLGGSIQGIGAASTTQIGGILGASDGTNTASLKNCFAETVLSGDAAGTNGVRAGGIGGGGKIVLVNCIFTGSIEAEAASAVVGGIGGSSAAVTNGWYDSEKVSQKNGGKGTAAARAELDTMTLPAAMAEDWESLPGLCPVPGGLMKPSTTAAKLLDQAAFGSGASNLAAKEPFRLSKTSYTGATVTWRSSNSSLVSLQDTGDGFFLATPNSSAEGNATLTGSAAVGGKTATKTISVKVWQGCSHTDLDDAVKFTAGDGTAENPYEITNAAQLDHLRLHLDAHAILMNDVDLDEFCQTSELNPTRITAGGIGWRPIGSDGTTREGKPFTGSFDGRGHIVSNMTIQGRTTGNWSNTYGLFGFAKSGASIENLILENPQITVSGNNGFEAGTVLALSKSEGVLLENIAVLGGSVTGLGTSGEHRLGGVVSASQDVVSTIRNCTADTIVSSNSAEAFLGGIVGKTGNAKMENCVFTGTLREGTAAAGGISGQTGTQTNCWYNADNTAQWGEGTGAGLSTGELAKLELPESAQGQLVNKPGMVPVPQALIENAPKKTLDLFNKAMTAVPNEYGTASGDLYLPLSGYGGSAFTWISSDSDVVRIGTPESQAGYVVGRILPRSSAAEAVLTAGGKSYSFLVGGANGCKHISAENRFTEGDGSAENPYQINTAEQLAHMAEHATNGEHFLLMNNIDLKEFCESSELNPQNTSGGGIGWEPIGGKNRSIGEAFDGFVDGNGYCISNLTITSKATGTLVYGLFGQMKNGSISNLYLDQADISVTNATTPLVGALLGEVNNSGGTAVAIENCGVLSGNVYVNGTSWAITGGMAGNVENGKLNLTGCYNGADVTTQINNANQFAAGFVGRVRNTAGVQISDSVNVGSVRFNGTQQGYLSGIAASDTSSVLTVENSYYDSNKAIPFGDIQGEGLSTSEFTTGALPAGLQQGAWTAAAGSYPVPAALGLKGTALKNAAALGAAALPTGAILESTAIPVTGVFGVPITYSVSPESPELATAGAYAIEGGQLKIKRPDIDAPDLEFELTAAAGSRSRTVSLTIEKSANGCIHEGAAAFTAGSGTAADPYQISTPEQLDHVRAHLDASYVLMNDLDLKDICDDNISAGGIGWKPIGGDGTNAATFFTGSFDGKNHVIANLLMRVPDAANTEWKSTYGLFGNVNGGAVLQNLILENPVIEFTGNKVVYGAGPLFGFNNTSPVLVENVAVLGGSLSSASASSTVNLGGMMGTTITLNQVTLRNCYSGVKLECGSTSARMGGIIAYTYGSVVTNCMYGGSVRGTSGSRIGGICGFEEKGSSILTNCWYDSTKVNQQNGGKGSAAVSSQLAQMTMPSAYSLYWEKEDGFYPVPKIVASARKAGEYLADFLPVGADAGEGSGFDAATQTYRLKNYFVLTPEAGVEVLEDTLSAGYELTALPMSDGTGTLYTVKKTREDAAETASLTLRQEGRFGSRTYQKERTYTVVDADMAPLVTISKIFKDNEELDLTTAAQGGILEIETGRNLVSGKTAIKATVAQTKQVEYTLSVNGTPVKPGETTLVSLADLNAAGEILVQLTIKGQAPQEYHLKLAGSKLEGSLQSLRVSEANGTLNALSPSFKAETTSYGAVMAEAATKAGIIAGFTSYSGSEKTVTVSAGAFTAQAESGRPVWVPLDGSETVAELIVDGANIKKTSYFVTLRKEAAAPELVSVELVANGQNAATAVLDPTLNKFTAQIDAAEYQVKATLSDSSAQMTLSNEDGTNAKVLLNGTASTDSFAIGTGEKTTKLITVYDEDNNLAGQWAVAITRKGSVSLSNIALTDKNGTPLAANQFSFSPATGTYNVNLGTADVAKAYVTPTVAGSGTYELTVNGTAVQNGARTEIALTKGSTTQIEVWLTGKDATPAVYYLNVSRAQSAPRIAGLTIGGSEAVQDEAGNLSATLAGTLKTATVDVKLTGLTTGYPVDVTVGDQTYQGVSADRANAEVTLPNVSIVGKSELQISLAGEGISKRTQTLRLTKTNAEAWLESLSLLTKDGAAAIAPDFTTSGGIYTVNVAADTAAVTIGAILNEGGAAAQTDLIYRQNTTALQTTDLPQGREIAAQLQEGINEMQVLLHGTGVSGASYTLRVIRAPQSAAIDSLIVGNSLWDTAFDPRSLTRAYTLSVLPGVTELPVQLGLNSQLTPESGLSLTVNGTAVTPDEIVWADVQSGTLTVELKKDGTLLQKYLFSVKENETAPLSQIENGRLTVDGAAAPTFQRGQYRYETTVENFNRSQVTLAAKDGLTITELTLDGAKVTADGTVFKLSSMEPGAHQLILKVKAGSQQEGVYYVTLNVKNGAKLTGLKVKRDSTELALTPSFSPDQTAYTLPEQADTVSSMTLSDLTSADGAKPAVSINGKLTDSKNGMYTLPLNYGENTIQIAVSKDGASGYSYTIGVLRKLPNDTSAVWKLQNMALSDGAGRTIALSPGFSADTLSYTASVSADQNTFMLNPTVTGAADDTVVTIRNGNRTQKVSSGDNVQFELDSFGDNTYLIQISGTGRTSSASYRLTIKREKHSSAGLSSLESSAGELQLQPGVTSYAQNVGYNTSGVTLTPVLDAKGIEAGAELRMIADGKTTVIQSGAAQTIALGAQGSTTTVQFVIGGANIGSETTYTITLKRGTSASISSMTVNGGTLSPGFNSQIYNYTIETDQNQVSLSPKLSAADGFAVSATGSGVTLSGGVVRVDTKTKGVYTVTLKVRDIQAQTDLPISYTVEITKKDPDYGSASLTKLTVKANGSTALIDDTAPSLSYTKTAGVETSSVTVNASAETKPVSVAVAIEKGSQTYQQGASIPLEYGTNTITVRTSGTYLTPKTYTVVIVRERQKVVPTGVSVDGSAAVESGGAYSAMAAAAKSSVPVAVSLPNVSGITPQVTIDGTAAAKNGTSYTANVAMGSEKTKNVTIVIAGDGVEKAEYKLNITKKYDIGISDIKLEGAGGYTFNEQQFAYQLEVPYSTESITVSAAVTGATEGASYTLTINGKSGVTQQAISLPYGKTAFVVSLSGSDVTEATYAYEITRSRRATGELNLTTGGETITNSGIYYVDSAGTSISYTVAGGQGTPELAAKGIKLGTLPAASVAVSGSGSSGQLNVTGLNYGINQIQVTLGDKDQEQVQRTFTIYRRGALSGAKVGTGSGAATIVLSQGTDKQSFSGAVPYGTNVIQLLPELASGFTAESIERMTIQVGKGRETSLEPGQISAQIQAADVTTAIVRIYPKGVTVASEAIAYTMTVTREKPTEVKLTGITPNGGTNPVPGISGTQFDMTVEGYTGTTIGIKPVTDPSNAVATVKQNGTAVTKNADGFFILTLTDGAADKVEIAVKADGVAEKTYTGTVHTAYAVTGTITGGTFSSLNKLAALGAPYTFIVKADEESDHTSRRISVTIGGKTYALSGANDVTKNSFTIPQADITGAIVIDINYDKAEPMDLIAVAAESVADGYKLMFNDYKNSSDGTKDNWIEIPYTTERGGAYIGRVAKTYSEEELADAVKWTADAKGAERFAYGLLISEVGGGMGLQDVTAAARLTLKSYGSMDVKERIAADVTGDGKVDVTDLQAMIAWLLTDTPLPILAEKLPDANIALPADVQTLELEALVETEEIPAEELTPAVPTTPETTPETKPDENPSDEAVKPDTPDTPADEAAKPEAPDTSDKPGTLDKPETPGNQGNSSEEAVKPETPEDAAKPGETPSAEPDRTPGQNETPSEDTAGSGSRPEDMNGTEAGAQTASGNSAPAV